ncbi:VOC family protein [uncultured Parolsenella sp.]|uniref:VOC family protein n=1 Tax=uncultured Parolsenella sp. TaxID=2083008 RepID=UPI0027DC4F1B|nr:VOC family protein [uncultured Parolsenella sp.]
MSEQIENPVSAFGLHVAHVGINAASPEEAREVAELFQTLMGLEPNVTPVSVFADTLVEVMSGCGRGEKGHIGFGVNDIVAAEKWFAARGFEINEDSRALNPDGSTKLVYFKRQIAGFAIHLCQD